VVEAAHPYAYYQLADPPGSTVATDSSGNGHNGTYATCVQLGQSGPIADYPATATLFRNQSGCFESYVPSAHYSGSYSVEAWIKTKSTTREAQTFLDTRAPDLAGPWSGEFSFDLKLAGTSNPHGGQALCFDSGDGQSQLNIYGGTNHGCIPFGFSANVWYYVAYTLNWATHTSSLYVNGTVLGRVALMDYGRPPLLFDTTHPLIVGANARYPGTANGGPDGGENFIGTIGQAAFYTSLLSPKQIAAHYRAGIK
jgi:hypothetical protein